VFPEPIDPGAQNFVVSGERCDALPLVTHNGPPREATDCGPLGW
jgi:hypothetical protein